ncbi:RluA family pseudouridine synthase [Croceicoccus marinus]|jgi:23S rRNA pseudouridine955/2504/2580 synthase|uniref:Ribosomal large subunit pseudouridine synthase D n=1 Tax=Croceicoccus marinus TaxID=450378 RepID=A0A7G6VT48_9SPHN|nr:RluA family pseudouridine synthase [Croceicoccus marinus]QNE04913.1 RluA family pseudouridine synthase [Croceicoccus marinus]
MPDQFPAQEDTIRRFTVGHDDDGARLDRWFKRHMPQIGFNTISRWARTGQIRVDGKRAKPEDRIVAGQEIRVPPGGESLSKGPQRQRIQLTDEELAEADAMVLHRDRAAIVLNKPPGLATQGGTGTKHHVDRLLEAFVPEEDSKVPRPRLVHRLDKDTSGVLLTAATPGSAAFFSKRFSGRSAKKIYWALVTGVPDISAGTIDLALAKQPGTGGEKMMPDPEGQPARTKYRVVDRAGNRAAWVELEPLTGRTHQLRVHLAAIGHPIVGDGKYGGQAAFLTGSISRKMHLHARRLIIDHPDGTPLDVTAPLPDHFAASMQQLGFDENASDALPEEGPPPPSREDRKIAARRHAKDLRKERRGERRERTTGSPKPGKPTTKRSAAAAPFEKGGVKRSGVKKGKGSPQPAAKSSGKPAGRPPGKVAGKPASRKPSPRKPGSR